MNGFQLPPVGSRASARLAFVEDAVLTLVVLLFVEVLFVEVTHPLVPTATSAMMSSTARILCLDMWLRFLPR